MRKVSKLEKTQNFDEVVIKLHHDGFSIIESIKILKNSYGLSLKEAKEIVDSSPAWSEIVEHSNKLIDDYLDNCDKKKSGGRA